MEYISAEEFLKQPKEIQKVFIDWWKDNKNKYDLCQLHADFFNPPFSRIDIFKNNIGLGTITPLLIEGQLRKFIEDKTGCKISVAPSLEEKYYIGYDKYADNYDGDLKSLVYVDDVLKGFWVIACKIASEEVTNE